MDYDGTVSSQAGTQSIPKSPGGSSETASVATPEDRDAAPQTRRDEQNNEKDDVFSDNEAEEGSVSSKNKRSQTTSSATSGSVPSVTSASETDKKKDQVSSLTDETKRISLGSTDSAQPKTAAAASGPELSSSMSEFKAMAADASVFTFGDEEDYESD